MGRSGVPRTLPSVTDASLERVADLLARRNAIDADLAAIIDRPMTAGHLGEWIAAQVFDIKLEGSAVAKAIDGVFRSGQLADKTVNIKWYLKREGLLDLTPDLSPDYYLVMTGPPSAALSSRGTTRPWCISNVYLFESAQLIAALRERGAKIGTASSVRAADWTAAEIYPAENPRLKVLEAQRAQLALFQP